VAPSWAFPQLTFADQCSCTHTGVYAVAGGVGQTSLSRGSKRGVQSTFGNQTLSVEAHLFDIEAYLYGATVWVEFCNVFVRSANLLQ